MSRSPSETVRRYFEVVGDLRSSTDDLEELLHPDARIIEHPNPITPNGAVRNVEATLQAFRAGKALLSQQSFDVHEVLVIGDRVAVRATWSGTVGIDAGAFTRGAVLTAQMAGFLTVRDNRIVEHETFDCYQPFEPRSVN
jgi:ketosteroid isomerase-like protein